MTGVTGRLAVIVCLLALIACDGDEERAHITTRPGDESIPTVEKLVVGEEVWAVGAMEGDEYEVLGGIGGGALKKDGVAVSDHQASRVHLFSHSGEYRASFGRPGQGPGELGEVANLSEMPDGTLAILDRAGKVEVIDNGGSLVRTVVFPGYPGEMCMLGSDVAILGIRTASDRPIHLKQMSDSAWTSIGPEPRVADDAPNRPRLVESLSEGKLACAGASLLYGRSNDGTVTRLSSLGDIEWETKIPGFSPIEHEVSPTGGIRHGPAEDATHMEQFLGLTIVQDLVLVQIESVHLETSTYTRSTLFLEWATGSIIGKDPSIGRILAAKPDKILTETNREDVPGVALVSVFLSPNPGG